MRKKKPTVAGLLRENKDLKEKLTEAENKFLPYKNALTKIYDTAAGCKTELVVPKFILDTCKAVFK